MSVNIFVSVGAGLLMNVYLQKSWQILVWDKGGKIYLCVKWWCISTSENTGIFILKNILMLLSLIIFTEKLLENVNKFTPNSIPHLSSFLKVGLFLSSSFSLDLTSLPPQT